ARRSMPTCCQQKPFTLFAADGLKPAHGVPAAGCFTPFATKIWRGENSSAMEPSFSSQTIHGTGSAPATVAPPATDGFSAVRFVWMFSEGTPAPPARSWPDGSQRFAPALKRLAKTLVGSPKWPFGSYHATQGTVRPAPAKSIDGASASTVGSMFKDAGEPCVTHAPFLKARTKTCCDLPTFCSNVAHGTALLPATTVPPATSTRPALWFGSMAFAASSFTGAALDGSDTNAADTGRAESVPASIVVIPSPRSARFISRPPVPSGPRMVSLPLYASAPRRDAACAAAASTGCHGAAFRAPGRPDAPPAEPLQWSSLPCEISTVRSPERPAPRRRNAEA